MFIVTLNAIINGLLYWSIWGIIALGFTLVFGVMDFVNFAQGFFVIVPAFFSYFPLFQGNGGFTGIAEHAMSTFFCWAP